MKASKRFYAMGQRYRSLGYPQAVAMRVARLEYAPSWATDYFVKGWLGY